MGPLKSLRYIEEISFFLTEKERAKICLIQQDFLIKLDLELNELKFGYCLH